MEAQLSAPVEAIYNHPYSRINLKVCEGAYQITQF